MPQPVVMTLISVEMSNASLLSAAVPPVPLAATWDPTSISDPKTEKTEGFYCVIHEGWIENSQPRISRGENEAKLKQGRD